MKKPGRNDPCPCGSGLKYKRCCLVRPDATARFTRTDRLAAFGKLERLSEGLVEADEEAAYDEFWGEWRDRADELDELSTLMSTDVFDMWFWFDRPLADGRLLVDRLLAADPAMTAGVRGFLQLARDTCVRLYEVVDVRPGLSVTLRDVLDDTAVTVHEEKGSRQILRADLLAARVIRHGVSGRPEMEAGMLPMSRLMRDALVSQLSSHRVGFRREGRGAAGVAFFKEMAPFFHCAWVAAHLEPPIPHLANTDGEDLLITRVHFDVRDPVRLTRVLDRGEHFEREEGRTEWLWSGSNREGKPVVLGRLVLEGAALMLETNSATRGQHGRAMIEGLAGHAVGHRATSHEDPIRSLRGVLGARAADAPRGSVAAEIPADVLEDLTLDHYGHYYRGWLDEPIPALDGRTPRKAATVPSLRPKIEQLIRDLEGAYERALRRNEPAYDPSWMRAELGLAGDSQPPHPPPLAHERWAEATPGWAEVCRAVAQRVRGLAGFDDASSILARAELEADLDVRRFLKNRGERAGCAGGGVSEPDDRIPAKLRHSVNHELHRRKTFWVDESLAYMLAQTDLDVVGEAVRTPFPSFALVFTDRHVLSLAERLLAADRSCPLAGYMLRVATIYVTEENEALDRVLHLGVALDALGADPPHLVEHEVRLRDDAPVKRHLVADRLEMVVEGRDRVPVRRPLPDLLHVVLNAILYATSADVESRVRASPWKRGPQASAAPPVFSSEEVFVLPGNIEISRVRQMQELGRVRDGRTLLHRCMVRGHWRRPAKTWKDRRVRWIRPYWKGPGIAAVIERTYKLVP